MNSLSALPQLLFLVVGLLSVKAILFPPKERHVKPVYMAAESHPSSSFGCLPLIALLVVVLMAVAGVF
jgi:hypothetical protein